MRKTDNFRFATILFYGLTAGILVWIYPSIPVSADIFDPFDGLPLRWELAENDCQARILQRRLSPQAGHDQRSCEELRFQVQRNGSRLFLQYRTPPTEIINELHASLWVYASHQESRLGFRIQFPYLLNPTTMRRVSTVIFGPPQPGTAGWQRLTVSSIAKKLQQQKQRLRLIHGPESNFRGAFVDAVIVNIYDDSKEIAVRLDDLTVKNMVHAIGIGKLNRRNQPEFGIEPPGVRSKRPPPFPLNQVTRIVEYNGEKLAWLRLMGFDAILVSQDLNTELLREAVQTGMAIYATPPTAPKREWDKFLDPIKGWYLGTSLNHEQLAQTRELAKNLERLPARWVRPVLAAPAESWSQYGHFLQASLYDVPLPHLGLAGDEEIALISDQILRTNRPIQTVIGIQTSPPKKLVNQLAAIAAREGVPSTEYFDWHPIWLQAVRALEHCPHAILFRSSRPLTSGLPVDQPRNLATSYVNRIIQLLGPIVAMADPAGELECQDASYHAARIRYKQTDIVLVTSKQSRASKVRTTENNVLQIKFPSSIRSKYAWRLTNFSVQRMPLQPVGNHATLQLPSPDIAEWIVVSSNPSLGSKLRSNLAKLANEAAVSRWQLVKDTAYQMENDRRSVFSGNAIRNTKVFENSLIAVANRLADSEQYFRAGDASESLRQTQQADGLLRVCDQLLTDAIWKPNVGRISDPLRLAENTIALQMASVRLMDPKKWSRNLLAGGSLDSESVLKQTGWKYDRRIDQLAKSDVSIVETDARQGKGCLRVEVVASAAEALPGGYAGTAIRIRSPMAHCGQNTPIKIDAQIKTLGFGGPHQGVLIYDSVGGPSLGVLIRGAERWQPVQLRRQTYSEKPVQVFFEVIGAGEAFIDDVRISQWNPERDQSARFRPISGPVGQGSR